MFWSSKKTEEVSQPLPQTRRVDSSTHEFNRRTTIGKAIGASFPVKPVNHGTMDFFDQQVGIGNNFGQSISNTHINYFGSKGFIGYQSCAILAQHWLIDHACTIPCEDAVRKGWEITKNDGQEFDEDVLTELHQLETNFKLRESIVSFAKMGRVYGVRVAVFMVGDQYDPEYYQNPFNIDGVKPGSFRGVLMNDPYYTVPLVSQNGQDQTSLSFYEPEFWVIGGKKFHKSHCVIFRHSEVAQILKPSYIYGGLSLTQQIYEAVYNAEISANEIPMLLQNMRMEVLKVDLAQALANPQLLYERLGDMVSVRNNFDTRLIGLEDELTRTQTTLTGLDELVLGCYKIVASIAQMPVAKLLKTDLTGGLVKGGGEEAIYHETLESLQCKMLPFLQRFYQLVIKSEFDISDNLDIVFNKLDAMTERELAETNALKATTDMQYVQMGAVDGQDVRTKIIAEPESGYNGLDANAPEPMEDEGGGF